MNLHEAIMEDDFCKKIWDMKYSMGKFTPRYLFDFVSSEMSKVYYEKDLQKIYHAVYGKYPKNAAKEFHRIFHQLMLNAKFLPGGRVLAGMALKLLDDREKITLQNCYCIPIKEDSLQAILRCGEEMAITYAWGGGVGTDISGLRPTDALVKNASISSTGPTSFMRIYDSITGIVGQQGRRGALLISMADSHPNIFEFIKIKTEYELSNMNISVRISDKFMEKIKNNSDWELWYPEEIKEDKPVSKYQSKPMPKFQTVDYPADCYKYPNLENFYVLSDKTYRRKKVYKVVKAQELWNLLCKSAWEEGCPGIMYIDTMVNGCPFEYTQYKFHGTNPCGEEPLPGYAACNLGAINLSQYPKITEEYLQDCKLATFFLDCILEYSIQNNMFPYEQQKQIASELRILGLGITGLHDMLIKNKLIYGSEEAVTLTKDYMHIKERASIEMSQELGNILGVYQEYDEQKADHKPRRNVQLSTVAPTGTISLLLGCSTGLEPIFALEYDKRIMNKQTGVYETETVYHPLYKELKNNDEYKDIWITAQKIDAITRLQMQEACQKFTDGSISSTVNLPNSATIENVSDIYFEAWNSKLKGITIFRDGCFREGVLKSKDKKEPEIISSIEQTLTDKIINRDEVEILSGKTIQIPFEPSWYVTINENTENLPVEVFINAGKSGSNVKAETEAFGRLISLYLQEGGSIHSIIKSLQGIKGKETLFKKNWVIQSRPDAIAKALEKVINTMHITKTDNMEICPECGEVTFVVSAGCGHCENEDCLFTNCG